MKRYLSLVLVALIVIIGLQAEVGAQMTESPLKFSFSHDFLRNISLSSGGGILSVLDNLRLEDAQLVAKDGKTLYFRGMEISHSPASGAFDLRQTFDQQKNQMQFSMDEAVGAGFEGTVQVFEDLDLSSPYTDQEARRVTTIDVTGKFAGGKVVMDFAFYKPIPEEHMEHLKKLKLPELKTEHLAFQIVDHNLGIKQDSINLAFREQKYVGETEAFLKQHIPSAIAKAVQRRIDQVNDPKEFLDSLNFANFSLANVKESFQGLVDKIEFKLPDKLMLPGGAFFIANTMASKIQVVEKGLVIEFDPRNYGALSEQVQEMLQDVVHPKAVEDDDRLGYSMTLDQNILNSAVHELIKTKREVSLRKLMAMVDKNAKTISHLTTKLLSLNMPSLAGEYGSNSQVDLITTIDTEKFMEANKGDHHVFTIDQHGNVRGNLNIVTYMKVAPPDLVAHVATHDESKGSGKAFDKKGVDLLIDSEDWPIARTIYASFTVKGRVTINNVAEGVSRLSLGIDSFLISKLDFFRGLVDQEGNKEEEDDDDFEDEDEVKSSAGKTMEGMLIMALVNMQLGQRLNSVLPTFDHDFTTDAAQADFLDCYGIKLGIPELQYFKGGFQLKGDYEQTAIDEAACADITADSTDLLNFSSLIPNDLQMYFEGLDGMYDYLEEFSPEFASYFMKPSEIVNIATDEGVEALASKVGDKLESLFGSISVNLEGSDLGDALSVGKIFHGFLENMIVTDVKRGNLQFTKPNKYTDTAFGHDQDDDPAQREEHPEFQKNKEEKEAFNEEYKHLMDELDADQAFRRSRRMWGKLGKPKDADEQHRRRRARDEL